MILYFAIFILVFIAATLFGSGELSILNNCLISNESSQLEICRTILFDIRLPRNIVASFSGASLALAGCVSQGVFRNPLASPSIIGTNSGGVFATILVFYFGLAWNDIFYIPAASILGSIISTALVLWIFNWQRMQSVGSLLLLGFAINAFLTGLTSFTLSFLLSDYQKSTSALRWILGSFSSTTWSQVTIVASTFLGGAIISYALSYKLDVLALGENIAKNLAIDVTKLRNISILCLSILVGGSISVAGGIPFIGLIVPHITRILVGPNSKKLFILSAANGATLTLLCDVVARNLTYPVEIEVGSITTLIGAPFFIWLLVTQNKENKGGLV